MDVPDDWGWGSLPNTNDDDGKDDDGGNDNNKNSTSLNVDLDNNNKNDNKKQNIKSKAHIFQLPYEGKQCRNEIMDLCWTGNCFLLHPNTGVPVSGWPFSPDDLLLLATGVEFSG